MMTMTVKTAWVLFTFKVREAVIRFFLRRSTQTHLLAFVLGMAIGVVGLRAATPVIEVETAAPEVIVATQAPAHSEYQVDYDAACVARVLYGIRGYNLSEKAKTAVIEVIQNRAADTACEFRAVSTVAEVCEQPNQWQGFSANGTYLEEDYALALSVLNDTSPVRTIPTDCFFLLVKDGEVIVRTQWDGGNEWSVR